MGSIMTRADRQCLLMAYCTSASLIAAHDAAGVGTLVRSTGILGGVGLRVPWGVLEAFRTPGLRLSR